jgi:hypothetical protein
VIPFVRGGTKGFAGSTSLNDTNNGVSFVAWESLRSRWQNVSVAPKSLPANGDKLLGRDLHRRDSQNPTADAKLNLMDEPMAAISDRCTAFPGY